MVWLTGVLHTTFVLFTIVSASHPYSDNSEPLNNSAASCEQARSKCAYRTGCGGALTKYLEACSEVIQGVVSHCSERCQYALVALTSTDEGKTLMTCECNDDFCESTKLRMEICRPQVINAIQNDTVPCRFAQWICAADPQCSTALDYYNQYCKSMFHGKKCSRRCQNSISILQRQDKAAKLNTCRCDGQETYPCRKIQLNMQRLCFPHEHQHRHPEIGDPETNEIRPVFKQISSAVSYRSNLILAIVLIQIIAFIT